MLNHPSPYYTASWSPVRKFLFSDTNLKVWVADVAGGEAKVVGNDPWVVANRALDPIWSPDSKWVAYASRLRSMYHAIFISNVETGVTKQVTDGLADALSPAWDASGKYLWFLASTDFGLGSQWLDMTSYDHDENFGLYVAVLKKTEVSPLLPESDEDKGVGSATPSSSPCSGRGNRTESEAADSFPIFLERHSQSDQPPQLRGAHPARDSRDRFDELQQRIVSVTASERQYSDLRAGADGTVFFLEASSPRGQEGTAGPRGNELCAIAWRSQWRHHS